MIANHGQIKKYVHKYIGVNSRLDTIQAAILNIKLGYLDTYSSNRNEAANRYDNMLKEVKDVTVPFRSANSTHVFHQYTLLVSEGKRDGLKKHLEANGIPAMIYYPIPLNEQEAYQSIGTISGNLEVTEKLCNSVLSLPMHTELIQEQQEFIVDALKSFFKN
jgi:dTDP-4-amino-4,6-dideoxygalactose transaminase